jgi:major inositol transporter-like SP family MFS transporter
MVFSVFFLWVLNFIIGFTFPILLSALDLSATFFGFVVIGLLRIGFMYKFMPETNGRTLEELEEHFRSKYKKSNTMDSIIQV